jgi:dihydroanticapsin dehydrogenase
VNVTLDGKVAIVTGAAGGIGLATVREFLESGAKGVVGVDLAERPRELDGQERLAWVRGDVSLEKTAEEYARVAVEAFGRIDVMVNNAAVSVIKPIHEHTAGEWDAVMNVNVKAAYFATRHVIPAMMKQRSGVVLNMGSISGSCGIATQGAYGPSKGAIHQMTRQMAVEYAPFGIRVNAIACGTVDTPLVHRSAEMSGDKEKYWKMLKENHPIGRIAAADEVAKFLTYMASDLASFFTGAVIAMDGGYTAR